jgi:TatD DNase family protein
MFDSHTHLQDERLDPCRDAVLDAALAAGVTDTCCCGSSAADWRAVSALASAGHPGAAAPRRLRILPAFGVHPWYAAAQPPDWLAQLEAHLAAHPTAPVGEIGMDGLRADVSREVQRQVLLAQLDLAVRAARPVVLHGARAWGELLALLKPFAPRLPGFVAHAFSGSEETLREFVALGGHISFAGTVCNPAARRARGAAAAVPRERLLIETDAPDLLPQGADDPAAAAGAGAVCRSAEVPPQLNHPAHLVRVAQTVAALRGEPVEAIAALTAANARRVFLPPDRTPCPAIP